MNVIDTENRAVKNSASAERANRIRDISVAVYSKRLDQECKGNAARMLAKDNDGGVKMRGRAAIYDGIVRAVLETIGVRP